MPIKDFHCQCGKIYNDLMVDLCEAPECPNCGEKMTVSMSSYKGMTFGVHGFSYKNGYSKK